MLLSTQEYGVGMYFSTALVSLFRRYGPFCSDCNIDAYPAVSR